MSHPASVVNGLFNVSDMTAMLSVEQGHYVRIHNTIYPFDLPQC